MRTSASHTPPTAANRAARPLLWAWPLSLLAVSALLGYGYYLQYVEYLDPCPLCITQRLFYYGIGLVALIALFRLASVGFQRICSLLMGLCAAGGMITAGRQVWLQHLPPEAVPECGPGLQYWLDNKPWLKTLELLFKGDGNCAEVHWRFLGLSIGEWSLGWFTGFVVLAITLFIVAGRSSRAAREPAGSREQHQPIGDH